MIEITKDTIIGEVLDIAPQTAPIFLSIGMHCLGCMASRGETVEEACAVHGVDVTSCWPWSTRKPTRKSSKTAKRIRKTSVCVFPETPRPQGR